MNSDDWVLDRLPEPFKKVLVYDLIEGQMVGYFDVRRNIFLDINDVTIGYVAGWKELSENPKTTRTLLSNIMSYKPNLKSVKVDVK